MQETFKDIKIVKAKSSPMDLVPVKLEELNKFKMDPIAFSNKETFQAIMVLEHREVLEGYMRGIIPANLATHFDMYSGNKELVLVATYLDGVEIDSVVEVH